MTGTTCQGLVSLVTKLSDIVFLDELIHGMVARRSLIFVENLQKGATVAFKGEM